jgi:hypothetical protein
MVISPNTEPVLFLDLHLVEWQIVHTYCQTLENLAEKSAPGRKLVEFRLAVDAILTTEGSL